MLLAGVAPGLWTFGLQGVLLCAFQGVLTSLTSQITSLTSDKLYYSSVAVDENGDSKLDADFVGIINTKTLTSGSSIYAAEVIGDTTKIYKITTKGASLAADDTVSLIATLDTALTHNGGNIIA